MSNEQTLQQYNEQLENNNNSLDNILEIINELPEAGEDVEEEVNSYGEEIEEQGDIVDELVYTLRNRVINAGTQTQNNYSTEEQVIGTWIDSKPIYRKLFTGSTATGKNLSAALTNDTIIGDIIHCYGHVQGSYGEQLGLLSDKQALLLADNHKTLTYYFNNTDSYSYTYTIIIEYTKATD